METLDHDYSLHTRQGAGDDKLYVVFYNHYTLNDLKTAEEGRPVHDDAVFIRIVTPGDRDNIIDRMMRPEDKFRFPKQFERFKAGEAEIGSGTRLEEWTMMPRSMVEDLRYFGFRTVEHVAEAHDAIMSKTPGLREWQARAKAFLKAAGDTAAVSKAEAERAALQNQIETLQQQVAELSRMAKVPEGGVPVTASKDK